MTCKSREQCTRPTKKEQTHHQKNFNNIQTLTKCMFGSKLKSQLILLFNLFFVLFIGSTALVGIIYESYYIIWTTNFYLYL